jgi:hypothetical protein
MSTDLEKAAMASLRKEGLPLGYGRIITSDTIIDDEATKRATLALPKYRHAVMYVRPAGKPISKLEL